MFTGPVRLLRWREGFKYQPRTGGVVQWVLCGVLLISFCSLVHFELAGLKLPQLPRNWIFSVQLVITFALGTCSRYFLAWKQGPTDSRPEWKVGPWNIASRIFWDMHIDGCKHLISITKPDQSVETTTHTSTQNSGRGGFSPIVVAIVKQSGALRRLRS